MLAPILSPMAAASFAPGRFAAALARAAEIARRVGGFLIVTAPNGVAAPFFSDTGGAVQAVLGEAVAVARGRGDALVVASQSTLASRPTMEAAGNGYTELRFGVDRFMAGPAPAVLPAAETIIAAGRWTAMGTSSYMLSRRVGSSGVMIRKEASDQIIATALTGGSFGTVDCGAAVAGQPVVISLSATTNNNQAWRGGVLAGTSATVFAAADISTALGLGDISGAGSGGTTGLRGALGLGLYAPVSLSDADRRDVEFLGALVTGAPWQ